MIFDFHTHSKYSFDSILDPTKMLKVAKKRGLDGIAITDHDTIKGGIIAQKNNDDRDFIVIIGSEIKTDIGDIIGLFLNEEIKNGNSMDVVEEIHAQGGIAILPHPFRGHKLNEEIVGEVDLIEAFNSRTSRQGNILAKEFAERFEKPTIAGSDAHFATEIGNAKTLVDNFNYDDLKNSMINGCTKIIYDVQSYYYLQNYSQLIKVIKNKNYALAPNLMVKTVLGYIFKVDPNFVIRHYIPNDEIQKNLDKYQKYYNDWIWRYHHRQRVNNVNNIINKMNMVNNDKILEIGCGRGIYTTILGKKSCNVIGIEISTREINISKEFIDAKDLNNNITLMKADAEHLPFRDDSFDFVLCSEVLEHLNDPLKGAGELKRVLKTGKNGLVSMPNLISYFWFRKRLGIEMHNLAYNDKIEIDPHMKYPYWKIISLLNNVGLETKPLKGTHLFSGGLLFGFLINNIPDVIYFLNYLENNFNINYLSAFFFVEVKK